MCLLQGSWSQPETQSTHSTHAHKSKHAALTHRSDGDIRLPGHMALTCGSIRAMCYRHQHISNTKRSHTAYLVHVLCTLGSKHPCHSTEHTPTHKDTRSNRSSPVSHAQKYSVRGFKRWGVRCHHTHLVCSLAAPAAPLPLTTLQRKRAATTNSTCSAGEHPTDTSCSGDSRGHTYLDRGQGMCESVG